MATRASKRVRPALDLDTQMMQIPVIPEGVVSGSTSSGGSRAAASASATSATGAAGSGSTGSASGQAAVPHTTVCSSEHVDVYKHLVHHVSRASGGGVVTATAHVLVARLHEAAVQHVERTQTVPWSVVRVLHGTLPALFRGTVVSSVYRAMGEDTVDDPAVARALFGRLKSALLPWVRDDDDDADDDDDDDDDNDDVDNDGGGARAEEIGTWATPMPHRAGTHATQALLPTPKAVLQFVRAVESWASNEKARPPVMEQIESRDRTVMRALVFGGSCLQHESHSCAWKYAGSRLHLLAAAVRMRLQHTAAQDVEKTVSDMVRLYTF